ncbi:PqqD family protein [Methanobacterium formicicum]|nr:PqqD family protein [Methanobacterium formicicum]
MAIPRGGLIVLGMLSYLLNLKQSQFETSDQPDQPVMIVDDIALTGKRISKILSNTQSSHVVIANLYSHPDLRKSILEKEPRVKYCFSAHDLKDQARGNYPDTNDYYSWRKKMNKRMGGRYWIGQVDLVGFAWSEPDYPFWNPVTDKLEDGWRSLPPHKCLKNRSIFGILPDESATKDLQLSSAVIMGCFHDEIWLFQKDTQQIYSLTGVAAEIWRVLVSYGNIESSIPYLMDKYDVEESILRLDLESYVDDLLEIKIFKKRDS